MSVTKLIPRYAYIYEDIEAAANDVGGKREFIYKLDPMIDPPDGIVQVGLRVDNVDRLTEAFEETRRNTDIFDVNFFTKQWLKVTK